MGKNDKSTLTTLQASCSLLNFLKDIGKKGESYEQVIIRISKDAGYKGMLEKHKLI